MGKLMNRLQAQLKETDNKKDAEECIEIYNWLKETTGHVWGNSWQQLINVRFEGQFPYATKVYSLNEMGKTLLKGIKE